MKRKKKAKSNMCMGVAVKESMAYQRNREFRMARNGACVVGRRAGRREAEEDSGDWLSILEFRFYPKSIL